MLDILEYLVGFLSIEWIVPVALLLYVIFVYGTNTFSVLNKLGVPHKKPWPLIGNADLVYEGFVYDTEMIKKYGKVFGVYEFRTPVIVFCDPKLVLQICVKEFDRFVNRRLNGLPINKEMKTAVSVLKDREWKGLRNVMTPTFSGSKMKRMMPLITKCADELVKTVESYTKKNDAIFEARNLFGCYTMDVIATTAFGTEVNSQKEGSNSAFVQHAKRVFEGFRFFSPMMLICFFFPFMTDIVEKSGRGIFDQKAIDFFQNIVYKILDVRANGDKNHSDFLQLMLDAHKMDSEPEKDSNIFYDENTPHADQKNWRVGKRALSHDEIVANALIFFMVGYETTGTTMSWALYELALHPEIQERLHAEVVRYAKANGGKLTYEIVGKMEYLDQVLSETMRLWPAAQRSDRVCQEDCTIGDYHIEKGQIVNIGIWAMHRDEDFWEKPLEFNPDRFSPENKANIVPYSYIPFGLGPRNCIGMRLALLEAKLGLAAVLQNFRFMRCEKTEVPPMLPKGGIGLTIPKNGIYLKVEKR